MACSFRKSMSAILPDEQMLMLIENNAFESRSVDKKRSIKIIISPTTKSKTSLIKERQSSKVDHMDVRFVDGLDTYFGIYDEELGSYT
jgi:hypothetical protein